MGCARRIIQAFKIRNMRPAVGVELSKQLTPVFGLGVEGMGYINGTRANRACLKWKLCWVRDGDFNEHKSRFNANNAFLEMTAGLIYHFKNSNGKHHLGHAKPYSQAEIDALNGNINDLRRQLEAQNKVNDRDFATAECGKDWYVHEESIKRRKWLLKDMLRPKVAWR